MKHYEQMLDVLFAGRSQVVVGRAPDCDLILSNANIAQKQATLTREPGGLTLVDLGSGRRISLNGRRVRHSCQVHAEDRFGIGPYLFTLKGDRLLWLDNSQGMRLEARHLCQDVTLSNGQRKTILDDINLVVEPGDFICIIGPSGSGKSTLMEAMNGRRPAVRGQMLANGTDFYAHYHTFRQSQGYVPQQDIVHAQLPVTRALIYTAKLRLPPDTPATEIAQRVEQTLGQMQLERVGDTVISNLSGGQIKRVSLAAELLSRPPLLYIDEATSGLDPATEARMMALFRELSESGKTIVCITHALDSIQLCDLVAILYDGCLVYYGPPAEAAGYFGVCKLHEIYDLLMSPDDPTKCLPGRHWAEAFKKSAQYQEFVADRSSSPAPAPESPADGFGGLIRHPADATVAEALPDDGAVERTSTLARTAWCQFRVLTKRYVELIWRDKQTLRMTYLQAPVIGLILGLALVTIKLGSWTQKLPNTRNLTAYERNALATVARFDDVRRLVAENEPTTRPRLGGLSTEGVARDVFTLRPSSGPDRIITGTELRSILSNAGLSPPSAAPARTGSPLDLTNWIVLDGRAPLPPQQTRWFSHLFWGEDKSRANSDPQSGPEYPPEPNDPPPQTMAIWQLWSIDTQLAALTPARPNIVARILAHDATMPVVFTGFRFQPVLIWALIAVLCIATFWFGCNNAAKEIVKEQPIYSRERAAGLFLLPYVASKFLILAIITIAQAVTLAVVVYGILYARGVHFPTDHEVVTSVSLTSASSDAGINPKLMRLMSQLVPTGANHNPLDDQPKLNSWRSSYCAFYLRWDIQAGILALLSVTAVGYGLMISACVATPDRANALTPYVLIPQIMLCGAFIPVTSLGIKLPAELFSPVFWSYRALRCGTDLIPSILPQYDAAGDVPLWHSVVAMSLYTAVLLVLALYLLRLKEKAK